MGVVMLPDFILNYILFGSLRWKAILQMNVRVKQEIMIFRFTSILTQYSFSFYQTCCSA